MNVYKHILILALHKFVTYLPTGGMVEVGTGWFGRSGTQPDGHCFCLC